MRAGIFILDDEEGPFNQYLDTANQISDAKSGKGYIGLIPKDRQVEHIASLVKLAKIHLFNANELKPMNLAMLDSRVDEERWKFNSSKMKRLIYTKLRELHPRDFNLGLTAFAINVMSIDLGGLPSSRSHKNGTHSESKLIKERIHEGFNQFKSRFSLLKDGKVPPVSFTIVVFPAHTGQIDLDNIVRRYIAPVFDTIFEVESSFEVTKSYTGYKIFRMPEHPDFKEGKIYLVMEGFYSSSSILRELDERVEQILDDDDRF